MKTKIFPLIIILIFLTNCKQLEESFITFSEPQPANKKDLKEFPNKLLGVYKNYDTQEELVVNKVYVIQYEFYKDTISNSEKDSIYLDKDMEKNIKIISFSDYSKDSIVINYKKIDTLYNVKNNSLRKFKGHYFLNTKIDSLEWSVKKLSLKKNILNINSISTNNEIVIMEEILEQKSNDSLLPIKVKPTKKQFKQFIQNSGFTHGTSYIKIK